MAAMPSASAPIELSATARAAGSRAAAPYSTLVLLPAPVPAPHLLPAPDSPGTTDVLGAVRRHFPPAIAPDVLITFVPNNANGVSNGEPGLRIHLVLPPAGDLPLEAEVAALWRTMRRYEKARDALLAALMRSTGAPSAALVLSYAGGTPEVSFTRRANGISVVATVLAR